MSAPADDGASAMMGAALPPHLVEKMRRQREEAEAKAQQAAQEAAAAPTQPEAPKPPRRRMQGPRLEDLVAGVDGQAEEEEEDDEAIGPVLPRSAAEATELQLDDEQEQWKDVMRGSKEEAVAGREAWMTSLPDGRAVPTGKAMMKSVTTFSKKGVNAKVDSAWTMSPQQRREEAERKQRELIKRQQLLALTGGSKAEEVDVRSKAAAPPDGVERPKTLVELHQEAALDEAGKRATPERATAVAEQKPKAKPKAEPSRKRERSTSRERERDSKRRKRRRSYSRDRSDSRERRREKRRRHDKKRDKRRHRHETSREREERKAKEAKKEQKRRLKDEAEARKARLRDAAARVTARQAWDRDRDLLNAGGLGKSHADTNKILAEHQVSLGSRFAGSRK